MSTQDDSLEDVLRQRMRMVRLRPGDVPPVADEIELANEAFNRRVEFLQKTSDPEEFYRQKMKMPRKESDKE